MTQPPQPPSNDGINLRVIYLFLTILLVSGLIIHFSVYFFFTLTRAQSQPTPDHPIPPGVQQQDTPPHPNSDAQDLQQMRDRDAALLNSSGINPNGTTRIPIDQAIQFAVQNPKLLATTWPASGPSTQPGPPPGTPAP